MKETLKKIKIGDSIRFNNTVYTKIRENTWECPFGIVMESDVLRKCSGYKVDYLFKEVDKVEKVAKKHKKLIEEPLNLEEEIDINDVPEEEKDGK